ncbi:MAG TPA: glycosyltransferase [Ideonella sp.]|uniref:glycosyltransferase n=1 Tax=Ideonella sp. TaxID=1929293 RepID=UPI002D0CC978|nr:glycosyltransferase [Ideonella sp.]HSI47766.1 glycosyltransferase [Ideonella sp.]
MELKRKVIDLVYFNAGGGHRAAALALQQVLQAPGQPPCEVRLVNLTDLLDPPQRFKRATGLAPEDLYNLRLARGWTLGLAQELKLLQGMIRMAHPWLLRTLRAHWDATAPDLVVSLIPNFNRALYESVVASPARRCTTVMTDLADHPPHFWIEPGQPLQTLICGTPRAAAQALATGLAPAQVRRVSGMVLRPDFHGLAPLSGEVRAQRRAALGLRPDRPVGLVMFGGQGSMQMLRIARGLPEVQLVLVCGHNARLAARLRALPTATPGGPHAVLEFVADMAGLMQLADFFIGKPGPGSLSEAVQMCLPVVTFENRWTMPQERYNAHWVRNEGLGEVVDSVKAVPAGVARLLDQLPQRRSRVMQVRNRAVFEVAALLHELAGASTGMASEPALVAG